MAADASELSSFVAALEDMSNRVLAMADRYDTERDQDAQVALHEVERALQAAVRRMSSAQRLLRSR